MIVCNIENLNDVFSVSSSFKIRHYHYTQQIINYNILGDPTTFGNLKPAKEVIEAVQESVESQLYNGYAPSTGK